MVDLPPDRRPSLSVGGRAYFVAKYLGFRVRLYDGSFEEWSRHAELPVETGKESRD